MRKGRNFLKSRWAEGAREETVPGASVAVRLAAPVEARSEDVAAQLRARQVNAIKRLSVPLMVVNLVNVGAMLLELWLAAQLSAIALAWSAVVAGSALLSLWAHWQGRGRPAPKTTSRRTVARVIRSAAVFGLLWSVPGLFILPGLTGMALAFGTALLTGMIAGGAIVLFPIPAAATAFLLPVTVSAVVGLMLSYGWLALGPAILATAFLWVFLSVVRRHSELFMSEFVTRLQLEQRTLLIEDLLEDARLEVLGAKRLGAEGSEKTGAVGQLVAGIAHDFNNIFAAIQGHAELLALEDRADATLLDPIRESCQRGADEVRQLVAIAQKQMLKPAPVVLVPLMAEVTRRAAALDPRLSVSVKIAPDTRAPHVDAAALTAALDQLARNAAQAMPGGGKLRLRCRNAARGEAVEIAVSDTGRGMDTETREKACNPFFTTSGLGQGRGLGLSSVAGFARQSGGSLRIDSAPGLGTTVTLILPSRALDDAATHSAPTVLIVEGDATLRSAVVQELQVAGYRTLAARDAKAAIRTVAAERIDLVLSNILPSGDVTGVQLARTLRQMPDATPVAFYSNLSRGSTGLTAMPDQLRRYASAALDV